MKLPELNNLYNAFADCLVDDRVSPTEIYECLLEAIEEQENHFNEQLQRTQDVKKLLQRGDNPYLQLMKNRL